jgi:hypothetical protein
MPPFRLLVPIEPGAFALANLLQKIEERKLGSAAMNALPNMP